MAAPPVSTPARDRLWNAFRPDHRSLYLATAAPGVVELSPSPIVTAESLAADPAILPADFDLENGIRILATTAEWTPSGEMVVTVYWQADEPPAGGYSVIVHLVVVDPP